MEIDCDEIIAIASSQKQESFYLALVQDEEYKVYELKNLEDLENLTDDKKIYQSQEPVKRLVASKKFLLVVKESQNSAIYDIEEKKMHKIAIKTET